MPTDSADESDETAVPATPIEYTGYLYKGRFEPFTTLTERIAVKGKPEVDVTLSFTRHGPVLLKDDENGQAFALRAAWLQPGMAPYFGSVEYMRAENWREFVAALNRWGCLLYTSPSPRDLSTSRMPSSA